MKKELIQKIQNWTQEKADKFHDYKFLDIGEDNRYIWEKTCSGVFLWKDINAFFFSNDGKVYKLSSWSDVVSWKYFLSVYENKPNFIRMEIPICFERISNLEMGYSVVQRPGFQLGKPFFELHFENRVDTDLMIDFIENFRELHNYLKNLCTKYNIKFPIPPKILVDSEGMFWSDFKYWKYSEKDFVEIFYIGVLRYLNVLTDIYHLDLDRSKIMRVIKFYG